MLSMGMTFGSSHMLQCTQIEKGSLFCILPTICTADLILLGELLRIHLTFAAYGATSATQESQYLVQGVSYGLPQKCRSGQVGFLAGIYAWKSKMTSFQSPKTWPQHCFTFLAIHIRHPIPTIFKRYSPHRSTTDLQLPLKYRYA